MKKLMLAVTLLVISTSASAAPHWFSWLVGLLSGGDPIYLK